MFRFPSDRGKVRQPKIGNYSYNIFKNEKPTLHIARIEQMPEFCDKIMYLLTWNRAIIYNKIWYKENYGKTFRFNTNNLISHQILNTWWEIIHIKRGSTNPAIIIYPHCAYCNLLDSILKSLYKQDNLILVCELISFLVINFLFS